MKQADEENLSPGRVFLRPTPERARDPSHFTLPPAKPKGDRAAGAPTPSKRTAVARQLRRNRLQPETTTHLETVDTPGLRGRSK